MAIKITQAIREEETRAGGYLWTTENDPTWLRYQVDLENGAMKGFHISKCEGTVPRVTPFLYDFASPALAQMYHKEVAMAVMADIGKETMIREGEEFAEISVAGQVGAWQDFMGAFGDSKKKPAKDLAESRYITYDKDVMIPPAIVRTGKRGDLSMPRGRNFQVGARVSGFKAIEMVRSKGLPSKLKIGSMGDPDVDQAKIALAHVERPSSHAVAWYGTRDEEKAKYRLQAAAALPILAGLIADRQSLASAVDEVRAMNPILIETTGLSKAGVKRIGKLKKPAPAGRIFEVGERIEGEDALGVNRARHTKISGSVPTDMALRYLSELPPDRTPADDESWLKFNDILAAVAIPLHNATSTPIATILEASKGNWVKFHESLARAADFDPKDFDRRTMALVTIDALEAIDHFNRTALLPQALASIKEMDQPEPMVSREFIVSGIEASTSLIVGKSKNLALTMMEVSRRYASRIPAMMEIEGKAMLNLTTKTLERFKGYTEDQYPVITGEFHASNGLVIRPLSSGEMLTEESRRLGHCVGSYKSRARQTSCHIYSVQNLAGDESFSTFEYARIDGTDARAAAAGLRTVQHRAYHNGTPSEAAAAAKKEFDAALKNGGVEVRLEEINAWRDWLQETSPNQTTGQANAHTSWKSVLELDWEEEDNRMDYWREWGQVLGGRIEKSPHPGAVYSEKKAQELVSAMSPRAAALMIEQARLAKEAREAEKAKDETPEPM
jgi:hypothetical protein